MDEQPQVSPTGIPQLPVKVVPYLVGLAFVAALVAKFAAPHTIAHQVATELVQDLGLLGLMSPGLRKTPQ